ncbi:MAG: hypothetical protein L0H25_02420 [Micrococcales bacterium]|nr:hypothetical protein [Micrococcales bacterium]
MTGQARDGLMFEILVDELPVYVMMAPDSGAQSGSDAESAMARLRELLGSIDGGERIVVTSPVVAAPESNGQGASADPATDADPARRRARRLIADLEEMKPSLRRGV